MLNHATIQGRLTRDPELRQTQNGTPVAGFTVAWSEKYKETEQKLFMPCVAWGKQGEFVSNYFVKGQETIVEGKLITRKWEDKNGNNRETVELIVDRIHFCGSKQQDSAGRAGDGPAGRTEPAADTDWAPRDRQLYSLPPSGYGNGFAEMGGPEDDLPF